MTEKTVADTAVPPLVGNLPPYCRRDVDTLRRFVHAVVSEEAPTAAVSPDDFKNVLLTGATGFIGRFFLHDLLRQNAELIVHCIVRPPEAPGPESIRTVLEQADIWDESFAPRIRVMVGDVAESRFGLSETDFDVLCRQIDAVYHLAADINLSSSYLAIRKVNTFSIRNVLELCLRNRFKHLFYASTMGVFPQYFCGFAHEFKDSRIDHQMQPDLASMKRMFPLGGLLGYPWSKLTSEQILLFAQQAGMPLAIFRLPQTSLSSKGYTQANDLGVRIFAGVVDSETLPAEYTFRSSNEAVDTLSEVCTAISLNPERRFTIYHCCNPQLDPYDLEPADFGLYWPEVSSESFKRACQARGENSPLHGYGAVLDHLGKYWLSKDKPTDRLPICDRAIREDCPQPIKWPGTLPTLRRSIQWVKAHRCEWPYPIPQSRLDFDCLIAQAKGYAEEQEVPFDSAYPAWIRQNLQQLVGALNAPDTRLIKDKIHDIVFELSRFLRSNAGLARERRLHPEIEREEITRPVFIIGINRTGTTYLHRLMSRDNRFWALRLYECIEPVLPKDDYATVAGTPDDPRRSRTDEAVRSSDIFKVLEGVHDVSVDEPEEDFQIFRMAFSAWVYTAQFHIPEYGRWLNANGSEDAYAYHRRTMQHFTWQRRQREPGHQGQWLLKMPFHLMELDSLIKTYPDVLFIQTHREPTQFMGSCNSLVERVRSISSEPLPPNEFGAEQLAFMSGMLDKAVDFRLAHPGLEDRWVDVNYIDLVENPFGVIRGIYEHFGWTLGQAASGTMEEWHERQIEKRRTETRHRYALEDYGLTPEAVNAAFARYRDFITSRGIRSSGF